MTTIDLLEALKAFTQETVKDLLLPVRAQSADDWQRERPADVYLMRLPDSSAATKKCPYIIHQALTTKDVQEPGDSMSSTVTVRTVFCVYCDNESEGAMHLLNLVERLRIALLQNVIIGNKFALDVTAGIETLIYPDDTAPYFAGEMSSVWTVPAVQRNYRQWLET